MTLGTWNPSTLWLLLCEWNKSMYALYRLYYYMDISHESYSFSALFSRFLIHFYSESVVCIRLFLTHCFNCVIPFQPQQEMQTIIDASRMKLWLPSQGPPTVLMESRSNWLLVCCRRVGAGLERTPTQQSREVWFSNELDSWQVINL